MKAEKKRKKKVKEKTGIKYEKKDDFNDRRKEEINKEGENEIQKKKCKIKSLILKELVGCIFMAYQPLEVI